MQFIYLLPALFSLASAQSPFENWSAAGTGDARSPCPALNALANHDILPHDGKNITVAKIVTALATLNVSTAMATLLGTAALKTSSDPQSGTFTLENIKTHNILEHDGSFTRRDAANDTGSTMAEKQNFDQATYDEYVSHFNGSADITIEMAAKARWARMESSRARNPSFTYGASQRSTSYGETTILINVFQDPTTKTVPFSRIQTLFTEERFPYTEGWRPVNPVTNVTIADITAQVASYTPEDPI